MWNRDRRQGADLLSLRRGDDGDQAVRAKKKRPVAVYVVFALIVVVAIALVFLRSCS